MKTQDPSAKQPLSVPPLPELTEQDLKIQIGLLRQHVAMRNLEFVSSRAAAGQLSAMDEAAVQAFDQNEQSDMLNSIEGQAYLGGIRSPEDATGVNDMMANFERQYAGRLQPDYPERKKRIQGLLKMAPMLEKEGQLLQQEIPGIVAKHAGPTASIGRIAGHGLSGLTGGVGEPVANKSQSIARDIKALLEDVTAHHYGEQPPTHSVSVGGFSVPTIPFTPPKRDRPGGLVGTNKEAFQSALLDRVNPILEKLAKDGGLDDSATEEFVGKVADLIGLLPTISAATNAGVKGIEGVTKILHGGSIAGKTTEAGLRAGWGIKGGQEIGRAGKFVARHAGGMAGFGALGVAQHLTEEQTSRIEALPKEDRMIATILARAENGLMGVITSPVYHVGSLTGGAVKKLIGGSPGTLRSVFGHVAGGATMGTVFPAMGSLGDYGYNKLKEIQGGTAIAGKMMERGLLAKPHIGGTMVKLAEAIKTGDGLWPAITDYVKDAAPGMVAFGSIGLARATAEAVGHKRGNELLAQAKAAAETAKEELAKAAGPDKEAAIPVAEKIVEAKIEEIQQIVAEKATPKDRAVEAMATDLEAKAKGKPRVSRRQLEEGGASEESIRKAVERGDLVDEGGGEWFQVKGQPAKAETKTPEADSAEARQKAKDADYAARRVFRLGFSRGLGAQPGAKAPFGEKELMVGHEEGARVREQVMARKAAGEDVNLVRMADEAFERRLGKLKNKAKAEAKVEKLITEDATTERVLGPAKEVRSIDEAIKEVRGKFGKPISQQEREDLRAQEESLRYEKAGAENEALRDEAKAKAVAARVPPTEGRTASEAMASETIADVVAKERAEKKVEAAVISGEVDSREATAEVKSFIADIRDNMSKAKKQPEKSAAEIAKLDESIESYVRGLLATGRPVSIKTGKTPAKLVGMVEGATTPTLRMEGPHGPYEYELRKLTRDPKWKNLEVIVGEKGTTPPVERVEAAPELAETPEARDEIRVAAMEAKAEIAEVAGTPLEAKVAKENAPEIEKAKEMEAKLKEEAVAEVVKADTEGTTLVQEPVEGLSGERAKQVKKAMKRPKKATGKEHLGPGDKDAYALEMAAAEDIAKAKVASFKRLAKGLIGDPWSVHVKKPSFERVKVSRLPAFFENLSPEDEALYRTSPKTADLFEQLVKMRASLPPSENYSGLPIMPALKQAWQWIRSGQLHAEASMHAVMDRDPQTKASWFRKIPLVGNYMESPTAWGGWVAAKAIKGLASSRAGVAATLDRMMNAPNSPLKGVNRGDLKDEPIFRLLDKWDTKVADMVAEVDAEIADVRAEIADIKGKAKPGAKDAEHIAELEADIERLTVDKDRVSKLKEFDEYKNAAAGTEDADVFDRALRLKKWLETARDEILKVHPTIQDWRRRIGAAEEDISIADAEIAKVTGLANQVKSLRQNDPVIRSIVSRRAAIRQQAKKDGLTSAMVAELKSLGRQEATLLNAVGLRPLKQLQGAMRPFYQARSYANEIVKSRQAEIDRMTREWGLRNYVHLMAELDLTARENPETRDETHEVVLPGQFQGDKVRTRSGSPIVMQRKGGLERSGNIERSALRSMYAYVHYVWPFIERSKLLGETHEFLYGKLRLVPDEVGQYGKQVIHQDSLWTTAGMVREVIHPNGDVTYERQLAPTAAEKAQQLDRASEVASGLGVETPRVDYARVLLSRGLTAPTESQLKDPAWVKRNIGPQGTGNVKILDTSTAKRTIRAYRDGWFSRSDSIRTEDMKSYINTVTQAMTEDQLAIVRVFERSARVMTSWMTANALGGPANLHNAANAMTGALALQMAMHGPGITKHIRSLTRYSGYMFAGGDKTFDTSRLDAGASKSYRSSPAELAKMTQKERDKRVMEDDMFEDFLKSGVTSGNRGDQMRTLLGWRGDVAHADPRPGAMAKLFAGIEKTWWWGFNSGEYVMRWLPWADGYTTAIAEGKSRNEAIAGAFNRVHLTQMVYNQAARSKFFNHPMGQVFGNLSTWSAHWAGRVLQLPMRDKLYVMGVTAAQMWIAAQAGLNAFNALGSVLGNVPVVGTVTQNALLGIGTKEEDDPLGVNPKGPLYNAGLRSVPIPFAIPALEAPMVKLLKSLGSYVVAVANGNGEAASQHLSRGLQVISPLHGSQAKQIRHAFFDGSPGPDGSVLHHSPVTGKGNVRTWHSGVWEYALGSLPGTRWELAKEFDNAMLSQAANEALRAKQKETTALGQDTVRAYDKMKLSGSEADKAVYQQLRKELDDSKAALGTGLTARDVKSYRQSAERNDLMDITSRSILGAPNKLQKLATLVRAMEDNDYRMGEEQFQGLITKLSGTAGWAEWRAGITVPPALQSRFKAAYEKRKAEWAK